MATGKNIDQRKRFVNAAKEQDAEMDESAFEKVVRKVAVPSDAPQNDKAANSDKGGKK